MSKNNGLSISDAWNKSLDNGQRVAHQQRQKTESLETAINNTRENVLDHLGERDKGFYRPDTNYYFELKDGGALKRQRLDEGYTSAQIDLARTLMQETGMSREQALSHIERGGGRYDAPLPVQGKHDIEVSTKAHDFLQGGKGIHRDVPILSPAEEDALRQQGGQGAVDAAGRAGFDPTTEPPAVSSRKEFGHGTRAELVAADEAKRKALENEIEAATPSSGERARAIGTDTPEGLGVGVGPGGRDPDVGQHTAAQGSFPPSPDRPRRPSEKAAEKAAASSDLDLDADFDLVLPKPAVPTPPKDVGQLTSPTLVHPDAIAQGRPLTQADRDALVAKRTGAGTPPKISYPPSKGHPFSQAARDRAAKAQQHRIEQEKKLMSKNRKDLEDKGYQPVGESVEIMTDKEKAQKKIKDSIELINLAEETDEEKATRLQQWKRKLPELQQKRRDSKKAELIRRQENLADPIIIPKFGSGGRRITDPQTMRDYEERRHMRYGRNIEKGLAELEAQNKAAAADATAGDAQSMEEIGKKGGETIRGVGQGGVDLGIGFLRGLGAPESTLNKFRWLQSATTPWLSQSSPDETEAPETEAPSAAPETPSAEPEAPTTTPRLSGTGLSGWQLGAAPHVDKGDDTTVSVAAIQAALAAAKQKTSPFGSVGSTPVLAKQVGPLKWSSIRLKPETKKVGPYRPPTPSYRTRYA